MRSLETRRDETVAGSLRLNHAIDRCLDDGDITSRLVRGDTSALAPALDLYWDALNRYALRLVGDRDAANDMAQEAFVRLWEGRAVLRSASVGSYLYRVVHNLSVDELRKRAVRVRWLARLEESLFAPAAPGPAEEFDRRELGTAIDRALNTLPPRRREVFIMAYVHSLSYHEIADIVGISPATVKNHIAAALAGVRKELRRTLTLPSGFSD
jgi:RNA polymerase sigma-70 factor (family 1)